MFLKVNEHLNKPFVSVKCDPQNHLPIKGDEAPGHLSNGEEAKGVKASP